MRSVSSTDEICLVRIASAACRAVAKSSSWADGAEDFAGFGVGDEAFCVAVFDFAPSLSARTLEGVNAVDARAIGMVARKSRRFICGMVKDEVGTCNLGDRQT